MTGVPHLSPYGRRGIVVRLVYVCVASAVWLADRVRPRRAPHEVVLCYHNVADAERAAFARQMRAVRARIDRLRARGATSATHVRVTFDDALAGLLRNGLPECVAAGVPATVFAVTRNLGRPPAWDIAPGHPDASERSMTEDEIRDAASLPGVDFGSHTATHPRLTETDDHVLRTELVESRADLERMTGRPVTELAYPHGRTDARVAAAVRSAGYARSYTLVPRCEPHPLPGGEVGRYLMTPDAWPIEFRLTIDGAYRWLDAVRSLRRRGRGAGGPR